MSHDAKRACEIGVCARSVGERHEQSVDIFVMKVATQIGQTLRRRQCCVRVIIILQQIRFMLLLHLVHEYASAYTGNANHSIITCSSILHYLHAFDA